MSLWCGNCREEIFEGFALLYRLERDDTGKLHYAQEGYGPPNCAVCDKCWTNFPADAKFSGELAQAVAEAYEGEVFAHVPADSNNDPFWGSKTWSGIVANDDALSYLEPRVVHHVFESAVKLLGGEQPFVPKDAHNILSDEMKAALIETYGKEEGERRIREFTGMLH